VGGKDEELRWMCVAAALAPAPAGRRHFDPNARGKMGPPLGDALHQVTAEYLRGKWLGLADLLEHIDKDPLVALRVLAKGGGEQGGESLAELAAIQPSKDDVEKVIAYLDSIAPKDRPEVDWPAYLRKKPEEMTAQEGREMGVRLGRGMELLEQSRCSSCHPPEPGMPLAFAAPWMGDSNAKFDRSWLYFKLKNHGYRFTDEDAQALAEMLTHDPGGGAKNRWREGKVDPSLAEQGRKTIEIYRCNVCHDIPGVAEILAPPPEQPPDGDDIGRLVREGLCLACHRVGSQGGTYGPDLTGAGSRLRKEWLQAFFQDPAPLRPGVLPMPNFRWSEEEAGVLAEGIRRGWMREDWPQPEGGDPERGREVYQAKTCFTCHRIGGEGGVVGPDLSRVGFRLEPAYLRMRLLDPSKFSFSSSSAAEPTHAFRGSELSDLVAYLRSLE